MYVTSFSFIGEQVFLLKIKNKKKMFSSFLFTGKCDR